MKRLGFLVLLAAALIAQTGCDELDGLTIDLGSFGGPAYGYHDDVYYEDTYWVEETYYEETWYDTWLIWQTGEGRARPRKRLFG